MWAKTWACGQKRGQIFHKSIHEPLHLNMEQKLSRWLVMCIEVLLSFIPNVHA